jgi:hypothetical protein
MPRGRKALKEGLIKWSNRKANHGRKPSKGKKRRLKSANEIKKQR